MAGELPVMLNVRGRSVVIVGGGQVAAKKAVTLLRAGATPIRAVAPVFCDCLPPAVERVNAAFERSHLDGAWLALACTDDERVNDEVVRAARQRGTLVARADFSRDEPGDFTMMAVHRLPPVVLACSAGGSPGIARQVLRRAASAVERELVSLASWLQKLRPSIRSDSSLAPEARRRLLKWLGDEEALQVFRSGDFEAVMRATSERFDWPRRTPPRPASSPARETQPGDR